MKNTKIKKICDMSKREMNSVCDRFLWCNDCPLSLLDDSEEVCIWKAAQREIDFERIV